MKTRRILALLMAVLMLVGCMAACGGKKENEDEKQTTAGNSWTEEQIATFGEAIKKEANGKTVDLKLWGPEAAQEVLKAQAASFTELFKDYATIKITVKVQGENDAATAVLNDASSAADVFGFPSDQLDKLVDSSALAKVMFTDDVKNNNTAASVSAATKNGNIYGYPETGDNSYILVYDKRLVSDEQAKSFEGVIDACKAAGKNFVMDAKNGFFSCMFVYTGGLVTEGFEDDGITQKFNDYDINKVTASVKAFADLFKSAGSTFVSADTTKVNDGFKNNTAAAGIAGSWNIGDIKATLGDNAGYAIIPTININGTATQTINMFGYKFLGVNAQSKFPGTSQVLAHYLTSYDCQMERAEKLDWAPSNTAAQESDFVKGNTSMAVLMAQTEYSLPQAGIAGTFWEPLKALGVYMLADGSDLSEAALKAEVESTLAGIRDE